MTGLMRVVVVLAVILGLSPAEARILDRLRQARSGGAVEMERVLSVGGQERQSVLWVPAGVAAGAPLVVLLHGGGGTPQTMLPRWRDQAEAAGIVLAAPKGIGRTDQMGTWNAGGCCGEAVERGVDDISFVAAVIEDAVQQAGVDRSRVYVAGFSNGGMLTHRVALALSDRIAAAAVVSGALFGGEGAPGRGVPMLMIHGEEDPVVGFDGGISPTGFVARQQVRPFLPVRAAVDFWRRADGCSTTMPGEVQAGVKEERSTGCRDGAEVVFYDLPQGKHVWPSGAPLEATAVIWEFFQAHRR